MAQEKKKVKRLRLSNANEVRRYIANLMKRVENDEIEQGKARLLMNLAESILKSLRTDEIEKKIMEIEQMLDEGATANTANSDNDDYFLRQVK